MSHRYCLQSVDIPNNKAHYFEEKGEIIFHLFLILSITPLRRELKLKGARLLN